MFKSFQGRVAGTYIILIVVMLLVVGLILSVAIKQIYYDDVTNAMIYETRLVGELLSYYDPDRGDVEPFLQEVCEKTAENTDARVTIVDNNGKVLGDSMFDPRTLGSHASRPEIYQAMHGETGVEIRPSETAKTQMLYVALPFKNGAVEGVVRIARPFAQLERIYRSILGVVLLAILVTGLLAVLVSIRLAFRISRPLDTITISVDEIARGNLSRRIHLIHSDELVPLAQSINNMAEALEANIAEISTIKNRMETLLANTVNGILMVDHDGWITYVNPVAARILQISSEATGHKHVEVITNYSILEMIDQVRQGQQAVRSQVLMHNRGERLLEVNVLSLADEESKGGAALVVLNDITETKRLEQVRKDFVANVSHELKTPVATISGFAETLMTGGDLDQEHIHEFSGIIYHEAQRLSRLISRLLELSRLESGRVQLHLDNVNLIEVIQSAIEITRQASDQQTHFEFTLPQHPVMVYCDRDLMIQVMLNLLDNAIKFSPQDSPVHVSIAEESHEVKVMITDHGEGVSPKEGARVFERFYRVDKARSRKTGGTGLGLAIVKHLVEYHHGRVGVESGEGGGAAFFFVLPKEPGEMLQS